MIVVDASVAVDYLLAAQSETELTALLDSEDVLIAPQNIDLEVINALRRAGYQGQAAGKASLVAFANFGQLRIARYPLSPLIPRIWELRYNLTAYDAAYVALAETLAMPFYTRDRKLVRAAGHSAKVMLI